MTLYSALASLTGPAAATAFSGGYVPGRLFSVTQGGCFLWGYRWWLTSSGGQPAGPTEFALWNYAKGPTATGTVIPGSVVILPSLAPGWNTALLASPVQIAINTTYGPAIGVNGAFPDTPSQFGAGQPFAAGIVNGPLNVFSDAGGSNPDPYGNPQDPFTAFGGSDPTLTLPVSGNSSSLLWADVIISDAPPPGFAGPWRLWPNKFDADLYATAGTDAAQAFTLATEVHALQRVASNYVWFYSPNPAPGGLPTWCGLWRISDHSIVLQNASPSWLLPDGSGPAVAGGGWCKAALPGIVGTDAYKVSYFNANGASGGWSPFNYKYWLTGGGRNGITSGPLFAPNQGGAAPALIFNGGGAMEPSQGTFSNAGTLHYPDTAVDFNVSGPPGAIAESFWADWDVTPLPSPSAALTPSDVRSQWKRRLLW